MNNPSTPSDDPLNSADPNIARAEHDRLMQFMRDEAARRMEELRQKTEKAMQGGSAGSPVSPLAFGGIDGGGILSA